MPNYETLELLADESGLLIGYNVHFSNGHVATFLRHREKVTAENLSFESDGTVGYYIGMTDQLRTEWIWNSIPVADWNALP